MEVCCGEVEASLQMFSGMTTCLKDSLCLTFSSLMRICHHVDDSISVLLWWYIVLGEDLGHMSFHGNFFIIFYTAFVVQSLGNVRLFVTSSSLSFTISLSLLRLIYWVSDAIQPPHPLSPPPPPLALKFSQYQCLSQRVGSSHQVAKVLELQLQHQSF